MSVETVEVSEADDGLRLDRWFKARYPDLGHGRLQKLLRTGQVRVDGKRAKAGDRVSAGQSVRVPPLGLDGTAPLTAKPRSTVSKDDAAFMRGLVVHKDAHILVLDKPSGLAVQGGSGTHRHIDGMLDALKFDAAERPRLVHRLDKDTSGLLVLARTRRAADDLAAAFRTKQTRKLYWALVTPPPKPGEGRIRAPLAKRPAGSAGEKVVVDDDHGKRAETWFRTLARVGKVAWLALEPVTGRTHQLRVHLEAIGTPILGDGKYGGAEAHLGGDLAGTRLQLHAHRLRLPHPERGTVTVTAPLPADMRRSFAALGLDEIAGDLDTRSDFFEQDL